LRRNPRGDRLHKRRRKDRKPDPSFIIPSCAQFRSRKFVHALSAAGLTGPMVGLALPATTRRWNRFFALLQKNVLDQHSWATRQLLRLAIVGWIEGTYHRRRRQRVLGRLTPIERETNMTTTAARAA
jgi:putative transposase